MTRLAGRVSDAVASEWLTYLAGRITHLSLMTRDPYSVADPASAEPPGPTYARAPVIWARSGRLLVNTNALAWAGLIQNTVITHIGGWSDAFGGVLTMSTPITPISFAESATTGVLIGEGQFFVGLDL